LKRRPENHLKGRRFLFAMSRRAEYRKQAMNYLAAYGEHPADDYEYHVVRIARTWLWLIGTREPVQGLVDRILGEFEGPRPEGYGAAWDDLKGAFIQWAMEEEWL